MQALTMSWFVDSFLECQPDDTFPPFSACYDGYYGPDCAVRCGNCKDNQVCDSITGWCDAGCSLGFRGLRCDQGDNIFVPYQLFELYVFLHILKMPH